MLFRNNSYADRRPVIAASLTHFMLWRHIGKSENQFHLIMEDDALFSPSFIENWNSQYYWSFPLDTGIMFLGSTKKSMLKNHADVIKPVSMSFVNYKPNTLFSNMLDADIDGDVTQVLSLYLWCSSYLHLLIITFFFWKALPIFPFDSKAYIISR